MADETKPTPRIEQALAGMTSAEYAAAIVSNAPKIKVSGTGVYTPPPEKKDGTGPSAGMDASRDGSKDSNGTGTGQ